MKKLLLSVALIGGAYCAQSQVVVAGVSPAAVQGNYAFTTQTHENWPGQAGDGSWSLAMDFNIPGTFIQDTLMLVEDGTPGINPQGNPMSQEGCSPLTNDLTGKIAVIYRNTCEFGTKILNAQNAGAIAVIIVNREDALLGMQGATDGLSCTIPAVFVSNITGALLINEMSSGPVVMFIGNKIGAFGDDVGSNPGATLISSYGGSNSMLDNGFDLGIEIYNFGTNIQSSITVTANIDGPSGNVYNNVINAPTMNSGDTLSIFNGNPFEFPPFDLGGIGNYPVGVYTLTYSIDLGVADEANYDNTFVSTFTVNPDVISLSRIDGSSMPIANNYPSNSTSEYQSCMFFVDPNASNTALTGVTFVPYTDLSVNQLAGAEIFVNVYLWDDAWVDLNDPAYVGGANNDWFQALSLLSFETHYPASDAENGLPVMVPFTPIVLTNNQRYLICLQSFDPVIIFGYDNQLNYDANQAISAMPISPVNVDGTWYTGGWNGSSATSIALNVIDPANIGLEEINVVAGMAYPNPSKDVVTVSIASEGSASITITDVAGKVTANSSITLVDGKANVNIADLEAGIYIFNVTLENGLTSQFNVVKQ